MNVEKAVWVSKYRPETLSEVLGHDHITERISKWTEDPSMPNLLFHGPAGTGKTAIAHAFCRDLYGDEWRANVKEMNASNDRGIDVVREDIVEFARLGPSGDAPFKVIFLDEADQLTKEAQTALRRTMEDWSDVTRFILSCNYPNQIIDPLQSRCAPFRFKRIGDEAMATLIQNVVDGEGLEVEEGAITALMRYANGDARRAITTLQGAEVGGKLRESDFEQYVGSIPYDLVKEVTDLAISGDLDTAITRMEVDVLKEGLPAEEFTVAMFKHVQRCGLPADSTVKMLDKIGEAEWRIRQGANPHVQLGSMLADLHVARHLSLAPYRAEVE